MFLTTKGRYAVMAMVDIAMREDESPVRLLDVAKSQEIKLSYLEQIFSKLRKNGLVISTKGPNGGYRLSKEAEKTRLAEIIDAVNERVKMTKCKNDGVGCMNNKHICVTHHLWADLEDHIQNYLNTITLADVYKRERHG